MSDYEVIKEEVILVGNFAYIERTIKLKGIPCEIVQIEREDLSAPRE